MSDFYQNGIVTNLHNLRSQHPENLEKELIDRIGLSVLIKPNKNNSGTIMFEYKNNEQLDRLINVVKKNY